MVLEELPLTGKQEVNLLEDSYVPVFMDHFIQEPSFDSVVVKIDSLEISLPTLYEVFISVF